MPLSYRPNKYVSSKRPTFYRLDNERWLVSHISRSHAHKTDKAAIDISTHFCRFQSECRQVLWLECPSACEVSGSVSCRNSISVSDAHLRCHGNAHGERLPLRCQRHCANDDAIIRKCENAFSAWRGVLSASFAWHPIFQWNDFKTSIQVINPFSWFQSPYHSFC